MFLLKIFYFFLKHARVSESWGRPWINHNTQNYRAMYDWKSFQNLCTPIITVVRERIVTVSLSTNFNCDAILQTILFDVYGKWDFVIKKIPISMYTVQKPFKLNTLKSSLIKYRVVQKYSLRIKYILVYIYVLYIYCPRNDF